MAASPSPKAPPSRTPSATSTTSYGRRAAAPLNSTTPSRPAGSSSSNTSMTWRPPRRWPPNWRASPTPHCWPVWACPKGADGTIDLHKALTGPDLVDFVDQMLFPYLKGFKQRAPGPNTIEYKIGEIFGEITNKVKSSYNLREILEAVTGLIPPRRNDRLHSNQIPI